MSTEIHFDEPVNKIIIIPENNQRHADFIIGKYTINLDVRFACCETYNIYINGKDFTLDKTHGDKKVIINIEPSDSVVFAFGEKTYRNSKDWCYQKNFMTVKFSGGDRIRINRDSQYCGSTHANIYTRCVYLEYDGESRLIGIV